MSQIKLLSMSSFDTSFPLERSNSLQLSPEFSSVNTVSSDVPRSNYNLVTFLAVIGWYAVDYFNSFSWDFTLDIAAPSSTAKIFESMLDVNRSFVFKRMRPLSSGDPQHDEGQTYSNVIREISILRHPMLRCHPYIVKLEAVSWEIDGDTIGPILVLEKAPYGDLAYFMTTEKGQDLSFTERIHICEDIASAMGALHGYSTYVNALCHILMTKVHPRRYSW